MGRPKKIENLFKPTPIPKSSAAKQGKAGYDNPRENIDDNIRTKAISSKDISAENISADHIAEKTGGHGVVVDNKLYADAVGLGLDVLYSAEIGNHLTVGNNLTVGGNLAIDHIAEKTPGHNVVFDNKILVDNIGEKTTDNDVVFSNNINTGLKELKTAGWWGIGEASDVYDDSEQVLFYTQAGGTGLFFPKTHNSVDIGNGAGQAFADLFLGGTANIGGDAFVTGNISAVNATFTNDITLSVFSKIVHATVSSTYLAMDVFGMSLYAGGENLIQFANGPSGPSWVVINNNGVDVDFRVEGDTDENLLFTDGSTDRVGIGTATPTTKFSVLEKSGMTPIGGFAVKLTNETAGNTVQGQLVTVYSATAIDDAFKVAAMNDDGVFGIVLDAGVAEHAEAWIIVSGIADVLMDAGGSARGDRIISSGNTAGSGDVWNVGGAVATHFQEIGHCIETRTGAGLARCVLHFN